MSFAFGFLIVDTARNGTLRQLIKDNKSECPICKREFYELRYSVQPNEHHNGWGALSKRHGVETDAKENSITGTVASSLHELADYAGLEYCHSPVTIQVCRHTFCRACMSAWSSITRSDQKTFTCPLCRAVVFRPLSSSNAWWIEFLDRCLRQYLVTFDNATPEHHGVDEDATTTPADPVLIRFTTNGLVRAGKVIKGITDQLLRALSPHTPSFWEREVIPKFFANLSLAAELAYAEECVRQDKKPSSSSSRRPLYVPAEHLATLVLEKLIVIVTNWRARELGVEPMDCVAEMCAPGFHDEHLPIAHDGLENSRYRKFVGMTIGCMIVNNRIESG